jgi:hypothetical protein
MSTGEFVNLITYRPHLVLRLVALGCATGTLRDSLDTCLWRFFPALGDAKAHGTSRSDGGDAIVGVFPGALRDGRAGPTCLPLLRSPTNPALPPAVGNAWGSRQEEDGADDVDGEKQTEGRRDGGHGR